MKRIVALTLVLCMLFLFAACGGSSGNGTTADGSSSEPVVLETTIPEIEEETVTIYGEGVEYQFVIPAGMSGDEMDVAMSLRGSLKLATGKAPALTFDTKEKTGIEIAVGNTNRPITSRAKSLIAESVTEDIAAYAFFVDEDGIALVWSNPIAAKLGLEFFADAIASEGTLTLPVGAYEVKTFSLSAYQAQLEAEEAARRAEEERIAAEQEAARIAALEEAYNTRFDRVTDPDLKAAIMQFYEFYDAEGIIRWWAGLYDPDNGGFYYSNSGRDTEGYLPDMESTYQISQRVRQFNSNVRAFYGEEISNKIVAFYQTKQDPEDGYFYHPQWTKAESQANVMRYTRDIDWATTMLGWLGAEPLYPTAYDRLSEQTGSNKNEVTIKRLAALNGLRPTLGADWAPNVTSVTNYVNNLLVTKSTESWSNTLSTQLRQFESAGMLDTVLDILDTKAHPTYGCWVSGYNESTDLYYDFQNKTETPYGVYTAAYKILALYQAAARPVPYPVPLAKNAVKTILSEAETIRITYVFNPWATLGLLRKLLVTVGDNTSLAQYDSYMKRNAVNMVTAAIHTLAVYRQEDGSFSYLPTGSSPTIYGTPVAVPDTKEGDVNATNLAISFATHICTSLGVDGTIPIFNYRHGELFRQLLDSAPSIVKKKNPLANGTPASFNFNSDSVGSQPSSGTISSKSGTTFTVKNDPKTGSSNRVLEIRKNTEGDNDGGLITFPTVTNYAQNDDAVMVSEFKLYIDGSTRFGNSVSNKNSLVIMQVRYYAGGSCIYMPCFTFNNSDNPTGFYYNVGKSTSGGFVEKPDEGNAGGRRLFAFDTWYTFRLEFTMKKPGQTGQEFCVSVYVNGEKFCDSYCFYSDADTSAVNSGTLTVKTGTLNVRFAPQRRINGLIYLDDVKAEFK